ncbi:hypothetical protein ACL9RJ_26795 [Pseudomonas sp. Mn2068]|uniref:hypothetical protein n=1 Tax=Pseudomonas sp. Mn2068 TaxID=3395265 RepID=UPI003BB9F1C4
MFNSIAKKILGSIFLLLSLLCAVPASAAILNCTGTLGAVVSPGLSPSPQAPTVLAQGNVNSGGNCAIVGTTVQPASLAITTSFTNATCTGFTLVGTPSMTIDWDDGTTGTATYVSPQTVFGLPAGPFAANFKILTGPHEVGHTMSISVSAPPLSLALLACLLPGSRPVTQLGAPIAFYVN